jgi:hypothetical protein
MTQNKTVIMYNSTIGLFTTDISDKNLQPKVSVLQISFPVAGLSGVGARIPMKPHRLMIYDHHHCWIVHLVFDDYARILLS